MKKLFHSEYLCKGIVLILFGISLLGFIAPTWAAEEKFPTKPVHIWVGWRAGGSTDTLTRTLAAKVEKILGQPIVVENKPGGAGSLSMGLLKNAKPDGYTLGASTDSPFTRIPHTIKVKYDPMEDFTYIINIGNPRCGVVVKSDSPFKKFQDLIEFARNNPGKLTHGTPGMGNSTHLTLEKIARMEKVKVQHIPFKGSSPTITALLGGHVMVASSVIKTFIPHVKAGTLRPLLIYPEGLPEWPNVPVLKTMGYGFELPLSQIIVAPKGVPKPIVDKLVAAFYQATMSPQYQKALPAMGISLPDKLIGDALYQNVKSTYNFYGPLIKELGLQKK
jgi:tripartite-type tricarboxylate transporter receptor subunit TctC